MIEIHKYLNRLCLYIMSEILKLKQNTYNLRNFNIFECQNPKIKKID